MQRITSSLGIALAAFAVVFAAVVASRLEQTTIALLLGALIGVGVGAVSGALVTIAVMSVRESHNAQAAALEALRFRPSSPAFSPIEQPSPMTRASERPQPDFATHYAEPAPQLFAPQSFSRRQFFVIGEDGNAREL